MRDHSQLSGGPESNSCWTSNLRVIAPRVKFNYYPDSSLDAQNRTVDSIIIRIHYRGSPGRHPSGTQNVPPYVAYPA
jgi:hypothetical protein